MQTAWDTTQESDLRGLPAPTTTRLVDLGFSVRTLHRVARAHARRYGLDARAVVHEMTVRDLAMHTVDDLDAEPGFGVQALAEVREKLAQCGLSLRGGYTGGLR